MRIAIAGATGLVGRAIARTLSAAGHEVVSIGRGPECDVRFDLETSATLPRGALAGCDALVHAAGVTDEDFADRARAWRKAREGATILLEAAVRAHVTRLVYISTAHVYGPLEGVIDETRPPAPVSEYAMAHLETEALFHQAARAGPTLLVARPCAVFGMPPSLERFRRWSLIPFDFPRQAITGAIVLKSSGLQRRNFVSNDGVARLAGWWIDGKLASATVANAPGPHEMAVYDFALLCARIAGEETGRPCEVRRAEGAGPPGQPFEFRTRVGGHLPGVELDDHVRALVRALMKGQASP